MMMYPMSQSQEEAILGLKGHELTAASETELSWPIVVYLVQRSGCSLLFLSKKVSGREPVTPLETGKHRGRMSAYTPSR